MPGRRAGTRRAVLAPLVLALAVLSAACPSGQRRQPTTPAPDLEAVPTAERPYVVDPASGYPLVLAPGAAQGVDEAYRALERRGGSAAGAAEVLERAQELLQDDPGLHPAAVLAAQAEYLSGDPARAAERLRPVVDELPEYTAAQLLLGRVAEELDDPVRAYRSFRAVAERSEIAAERAGVLEPRAVEIVGNRVADALERGRVERAANQLELLARWAPDADPTLEATRQVARARNDPETELSAVQELARRHPGRTDLVLREAELELTVGDPTQGLQALRDLAERRPDDPEVREALRQGQFRWRLTLLPQEVQELARSAELTRAEFAVLVHWLIPQVRSSSHRGAGRIAGDIIEHPHRDEIARVVNLELMDVDPTLHTFSPERPVERAEALEALLRAVEAFGPRVACVQGSPLGRSPSDDAVCEAAVRCGVLREAADCLPGAALSGSEALELVRRAVELLSLPSAARPG